MTEWKSICSLCNLGVSYVPATKEYYLNHWKITLPFPIGVLYVIFSSYAVAWFCEYPYSTYFGKNTMILLSILVILFAMSYVTCLLSGPGYLPFYYPLKTTPTITNQQDHLSGLVTNDEQQNYIKSMTLPSRCHYFRSARRVVIRPDHLCAWTACFIGKKNHKMFFLFNFWGVIYISIFNFCCITSLIDVFEQFPLVFSVRVFIVIIYTILGFAFLMLTGDFLMINIGHIHKNVTQFEVWKNMDVKSNAHYCDNWVDIFGPVRKWYCWLIPLGAFDDKDEYSLAALSTYEKLL